MENGDNIKKALAIVSRNNPDDAGVKMAQSIANALNAKEEEIYRAYLEQLRPVARQKSSDGGMFTMFVIFGLGAGFLFLLMAMNGR